MRIRSLGGVPRPAPRAALVIAYGKATVEAAAFRNSRRDACVAGVPPAIRRRDTFDTSLRVVLIRSTIVNSGILNVTVPAGGPTAVL